MAALSIKRERERERSFLGIPFLERSSTGVLKEEHTSPRAVLPTIQRRNVHWASIGLLDGVPKRAIFLLLLRAPLFRLTETY